MQMNEAKPVTAQEAMSLLLMALGFESMAAGVATETDGDRLAKYARVIVKNSPAANRLSVLSTLRAFGIYPA